MTFEKQWSCFFSSMEQENHLSILELSEAQAGEVGCSVTNAFSVLLTLEVLVLLHYSITFFGTDWIGDTTVCCACRGAMCCNTTHVTISSNVFPPNVESCLALGTI